VQFAYPLTSAEDDEVEATSAAAGGGDNGWRMVDAAGSQTISFGVLDSHAHTKTRTSGEAPTHTSADSHTMFGGGGGGGGGGGAAAATREIGGRDVRGGGGGGVGGASVDAFDLLYRIRSSSNTHTHTQNGVSNIEQEEGLSAGVCVCDECVCLLKFGHLDY